MVKSAILAIGFAKFFQLAAAASRNPRSGGLSAFTSLRCNPLGPHREGAIVLMSRTLVQCCSAIILLRRDS
ncbi:hypothetical protein M3622_21855, partial [Bacillus subtilis]|nr:hypothetical protein [Bacillus subtilis]